MKKRAFLFAVLLLHVTGSAHATDQWSSSSQMSDAARDLVSRLTSDQRTAAQFPFEARERGTWSNLPVLIVPPTGLLLKDMDDNQRQAVQALLRASMSSQGYAKFTGVMRLENALREMARARLDKMPEQERSPMAEALIATRDPMNYAVSIFGEPGSDHWGWQLAGHHAAANFTISDGRVAFTPTFLGSSPRIIESGPFAGTMALSHEGDRGIELFNALTPEQQQKARVDEALPDDIFAGPGRKGSLSDFEGLSAREMDANQKRLLRVLVEEYVRNSDFDAADAQMDAIAEAGWDGIWFSWRGAIAADGQFYYRVHGSRVLIEYNRVDENHDHSIVRDPANDYGQDWLGEHIEEHHPTPDEIREAVRHRLGAQPGG